MFQSDGTVSVLSDTGSGNPYDGADDTEVGVLDNAGVAPFCVLTLSGLITSSNVCAKLTTSQGPAQSVAQASIDSTKIGLPGVPVITVGAGDIENCP